MGVLDRVKFWKKEDFALDSGPSEPPSYDLGARRFDQQPPPDMGGMAPSPSGEQFHDGVQEFSNSADPATGFTPSTFSKQYPQYPGTTPFPGSARAEQYPEPPSAGHDREMELVLAKLDAIKSEIDALHQRVRRIEQMADAQNAQQSTQRRYW